MKEHPILFSGPMVEAILEGRKTQTRRIIKPQLRVEEYPNMPGVLFTPYGGKDWWVNSQPSHPAHISKACDKQPGDRLWVRETWAMYSPLDVVYRAGSKTSCTGRWKPSIHMPRWASRITLEVASVRVERLQDITEADAKAEGFESVSDFKTLWEKLNKKSGFGWDANPWVWVIQFKEVK